MSTYDFLPASSPDQIYMPERYINPKAPPINLAADWLPLQLAWIFDKCNLYNPHIIVSERDIAYEPDACVERQLYALERHDHHWDIVELRDVFIHTPDFDKEPVQEKNDYPARLVTDSGLSRQDAERKIHQFNLNIRLQNAEYTNQLSPDL